MPFDVYENYSGTTYYLSNKLPYGKGRIEACAVKRKNNDFYVVYLTDGFTYLDCSPIVFNELLDALEEAEKRFTAYINKQAVA